MQPESKNTSVLWTGYDVLLFLALWLAPLFVSVIIPHVSYSPEQTAAVSTSEYKHPIVQLVEQGKNSPMVFLVAFLSAVIVAPLVEEFLFRLLLQGWLETKLSRLQVPRASGVAIITVSCFFAAIHAGNHGAIDTSSLVFGFIVSMIFSLLVFTSAVIFLVQRRNANVIPYFFGTGRFCLSQFLASAGYCLMTLVFIFGLFVVMVWCYPNTNVSPVPIFFFSLLLGTLYSKTRNLSYCILLHAFLNGTSLTIAWFTVGNF